MTICYNCSSILYIINSNTDIVRIVLFVVVAFYYSGGWNICCSNLNNSTSKFNYIIIRETKVFHTCADECQHLRNRIMFWTDVIRMFSRGKVY